MLAHTTKAAVRRELHMGDTELGGRVLGERWRMGLLSYIRRMIEIWIIRGCRLISLVRG